MNAFFKRRRLLLLVVSAFLIPGCNDYKAMVANGSASPTPVLIAIDSICADRPKVSNPEGIQLPLEISANDRKVNKELSNEFNGKKVNLTSYEPKNGMVPAFPIAEQLFGFSGGNWTISNIQEFRVNERRFQVSVLVSRPGVSFKSELVYTDTDGNGSLDLVCGSGGRDLPILPNWL